MLITQIRKLAASEAFGPIAVIVGIVPFMFFISWFIGWPLNVYQADARWIGEAFWILVLLLAAAAILIAAHLVRQDRERPLQESAIAVDISSVRKEADRRSFAAQVSRRLGDRSIVGYFERHLVEQDDVTDALVEGDAFQQACRIDAYTAFDQSHSSMKNVDSGSAVIIPGVSNLRTTFSFIGTLTLPVLLFVAIGSYSIAASGMAFTATLAAGVSALFFAAARYNPERLLRKEVISILAGCLALCAVILPPLLVDIEWDSLALMFPICIISFVLCYILANGETAEQCLSIVTAGVARSYLLLLRSKTLELETKWLDACEDIIMEHANLTINTILGKDKDLFLVEQDSEGLRRLQDPSYTVSTRSEHRIASVLSQMDAASIALAGPRGAGKSTLLRKFSDGLRSGADDPGISLYLAAPAEYIPADFISALFKQLCEAYLLYEQRPLPESILKDSPRLGSMHAFRRFFKFLLLLVRTAITITIIAWITRSFIGSHYHDMYETVISAFRGWYGQAISYIDKYVYKNAKPYWNWIRIFILVFATLSFLRTSLRWRNYLIPRKEPALAKLSREYLRRLQIEKSVTWGLGASLGLPAMRGVTLNLNKGGTASYVPWTFPELVTHARRFMQEISEQFKYSQHAVIVGIDEIDRIGSVDHAEKFIGEIKAIFGVERCFFLVAVAEDVGSIFAQRATAGRSILENAFDDIVSVEPLNLNETRDLLLKRVPGFTDSFVYLVHALSGGLPRELIRITRRLVDVNQEVNATGRHPRLQDLTFCLVKEELIEAIRATRNQLSRLALHSDWTIFFQRVHAASISLSQASPFSINESYAIIVELSGLTVPSAPETGSSNREIIARDQDEAARIVQDFAAFSFFGMTVIDAFRDKYFDLERVKLATTLGAAGSYEELAIARGELTISTENSRAMLGRFRNSLSSLNPGQL